MTASPPLTSSADPALLAQTVDIGIPTYRRPEELQRLLASLQELDLPAHAQARIIVVDNDPKGSARTLVDEARTHTRLPIVYDHEPRPGVANARNRILDSSTADYLVMVDDDEIATPGWLKALVDTARNRGSDAVFGRVHQEFPAGMPAWLIKMHDKRAPADQSEVNLGSTSNVLLRRARIIELGLMFDPSFNQTGGEDTDFFARLHEAGGRCHYSLGAALIEPIDPARVQPRWYIMRNFRVGQTNAVVYGRRMSKMRKIANSLARGLVAPAFMIAGAGLFLLRRRLQGARMFLTGVRNLGYAIALTGQRAEEYGVSA
ncbi:MAG: glycosyltransferase family 2 protein [Methylobacteriaceae bacterium]|nr:glycosyltransferase family 2 protein [Methylobacteriaceae bacterium]